MRKYKITFIFVLLFFVFSSNVYGVEVSTFEELINAINTEENKIEINLNASFEFDSKIEINNKEIIINGNGNTLSRNENYLLGLFSINENSKLNLNNIIIDGKSSDWTLDLENQAYVGNYVRVPVNIGEKNVQATESLIKNNGELNIDKSEFKNNLSTVNGNVIFNYKDLNINDTKFYKNHVNNKKACGAVVYCATDSTVKVENSKFIENILGNNKASSSGSCFYATNAKSIYIGNNCYFENNFAQGNGACFYTVGTEVKIENSKFINNGVGNDAGVLDIKTNENLKNKKIIIDNCLFDSNYGLSLKSQSMGSVIGTDGDLTERLDIDISNSEFCDNIASIGVISNHGGESDNIFFNIDNCNFHNNKNTVFNSRMGNYTVKNSIIENN